MQAMQDFPLVNRSNSNEKRNMNEANATICQACRGLLLYLTATDNVMLGIDFWLCW